MNKRKKQLDEFANNPSVDVFVLTVRSGAVGINLTSANHIFMMEPLMNPALYLQAINRSYRLGQTKKCFIHTLIMRDSIEQRIWNLNKYKQVDGGQLDRNIAASKKRSFQQSEICKLFSIEKDDDEKSDHSDDESSESDEESDVDNEENA